MGSNAGAKKTSVFLVVAGTLPPMTILHRERLEAMREWFDPDQFDELRRRLDRAAIEPFRLANQLSQLSTKFDALFEGAPTDALATEVSEAADELSSEILDYTNALDKIYRVLDRLSDIAVDADLLDEDPVRPRDSEDPNDDEDDELGWADAP